MIQSQTEKEGKIIVLSVITRETKGVQIMFWKKENKVVDERIEKESNKFAAKMYYLITALTVISLIVKLACQLPLYVYGLEIIALVASLIYFLVSEARNGILFEKNKDEELLNIHYGILAKAEMVIFCIIVTGELFYLFLAKEYFFWILSYFVIWMIPGLLQTIITIKNGWLIWGSKQKEVSGKKDFKKRVVYGSLAFGIFMGFPFLFRDGVIHPEGILIILLYAVGWGIPFYFLFMLMIKISEKKADKKLEEQVEDIEE